MLFRKNRLARLIGAAAIVGATTVGFGHGAAFAADPTFTVGQPCTFTASPGYYLNNGQNGAAGGFPRITPLLSSLPVALTPAQIAGLEANGVGGGQPSVSGAAFFTIDLNLAKYAQMNGLTASTLQATYNGTNVIATLTTLVGLLDANGQISAANQATFITDLAPILALSTDLGSNCGLTITTQPGGNPGPGPNATPELGSGELLATGLLPIGAILLYRRRHGRAS